jgi:hypothetical protein
MVCFRSCDLTVIWCGVTLSASLKGTWLWESITYKKQTCCGSGSEIFILLTMCNWHLTYIFRSHASCVPASHNSIRTLMTLHHKQWQDVTTCVGTDHVRSALLPFALFYLQLELSCSLFGLPCSFLPCTFCSKLCSHIPCYGYGTDTRLIREVDYLPHLVACILSRQVGLPKDSQVPDKATSLCKHS